MLTDHFLCLYELSSYMLPLFWPSFSQFPPIAGGHLSFDIISTKQSFRGINSMCKIYPSFMASGFCVPLRKFFHTPTLTPPPPNHATVNPKVKQSHLCVPSFQLYLWCPILKSERSSNYHKILSKYNNTDKKLEQKKCRKWAAEGRKLKTLSLENNAIMRQEQNTYMEGTFR